MYISKAKKNLQIPGPDLWLAISASLIPALLTLLVYLGALGNSFVDWDDYVYIVNNPVIRRIDLSFFQFVFTAPINSNWHPLTTLSWALDYSIWGLDPWGFHLSSVILHSLNTVTASALTTLVMARYTGTDYAEKRNLFAGAVAALIFGLHPYHVESVAWVSERKDLLCQLFYFLSVISYLKYCGQTSSKRFYYAASLVFCALALMSKPMAVSLPLVLLLLDFTLRTNRPVKGIILEKFPFAALSLVSSVITILAQKTGNTMATLEEQTFFARLAVALRACVFYLYKTILPAGLSPYYPLPANDRLFDAVFFLSLLLFAGICVYCAVVLKKRKYLLSAWLFFLITLAPVIGIVQVGAQAAADRYTYLPSTGIFILAGALAARLFYDNRLKLPVSLFLIFMTASLSYGTIKQIPVWKDTVSLWSKVIEEYPDRAVLAYYNRGVLFSAAGKYEEALKDYSKALMLKPDSWMTYYNRALVLSQLGRPLEAVDDLSRAIGLNPDDPDVYNNRGIAYAKLGDFEAAITDFKKSIELDPDNQSAYQNLKVIYAKKGAQQ